MWCNPIIFKIKLSTGKKKIQNGGHKRQCFGDFYAIEKEI